MKEWSLFPVVSGPMPYQMAIDEILFRSVLDNSLQKTTVRIYFSSEPWMTAGYSDPGPFPANTKICKRITGGGRVLHGNDIVFSLIGRSQDHEGFQSVSVSYWKIHEAVKRALETMGEQPRFYRCDEKLPKGGECFLFPIATDLELDGKKVAGGAQKRSQGVFLHQESIQLPARIDGFHFASVLRMAIEKTFEVTFSRAECDPQVLQDAKALSETHYQNLAGMTQELEPLLAGSEVS